MSLTNFIIILLCILTTASNLSSQATREFYETRFQDKKKAIDSLASATFGVIGAGPGFLLEPSYKGVFPEDMTIHECNWSFGERKVSAGDTFMIDKVSYPLYNSYISLPDSALNYVTTGINLEEELLFTTEFQAHKKKIKSLDINYIMPLWGILYCNDFDDEGPNQKTEKWWIQAEEFHYYFRLERNQQKIYFSINMSLSSNTDGENLEYLGCAIPENSSITLNFDGGHQIHKSYLGKERDCSEITIELSEEIKLLQNKLLSIELSLDKGQIRDTIKSKVQGDVLSLKSNCIDLD